MEDDGWISGFVGGQRRAGAHWRELSSRRRHNHNGKNRQPATMFKVRNILKRD